MGGCTDSVHPTGQTGWCRRQEGLATAGAMGILVDTASTAMQASAYGGLQAISLQGKTGLASTVQVAMGLGRMAHTASSSMPRQVRPTIPTAGHDQKKWALV